MLRLRSILLTSVSSTLLAVLLLYAGGQSPKGSDPDESRETGRASGLRFADPRGAEDTDTNLAARGSAESGAGARIANDVNIRVNQDSGGTVDQVETTIAVNPTDSLNLVGGSKHTPTDVPDPSGRDYFYSSLDGGLTWTAGQMIETQYRHQTDPSVAFCADGSAIYLLLSSNGVGGSGSGVFAYRSTDGGATWSAKMTVTDNPGFLPFSDKPWVTCDTTGSAFSNRIYAEWMDLGVGTQTMKLKWSADFGATWSSTIVFSDDTRPQNQAVLSIGPNGEVYVVWAYRDINDDVFQKFDRSINGGVTWGTDTLIGPIDPIPAPDFIRASIPFMDVDRSAGPHTGNIYVVWSDNRNGDPDILLTRSTDGGSTWSSFVRVNDDALGNGADQFFPFVAVDPKGRVIVAFWDQRRFIGGPEYEIWAAISRDGGQTFDTNFVVSDVESDSTLSFFLGDYSALTATSDRLYPFWTDLRNGVADDADVYIDRYHNIFDYDEVTGVRWTSMDDMEFDTQDARFGQDLDYDVVSGLLSELSADGDFSRATCAAPAWPAPPLTDARIPPSTDGYYYLVRVTGPNGVGSYGDAFPAARQNVRDALDDGPGPCP